MQCVANASPEGDNKIVCSNPNTTDVRDDWRIGPQEKLDAIVHDNASNIKNIGKYLWVDVVSWGGHTLVLMLHRALANSTKFVIASLG